MLPCYCLSMLKFAVSFSLHFDLPIVPSSADIRSQRQRSISRGFSNVWNPDASGLDVNGIVYWIHGTHVALAAFVRDICGVYVPIFHIHPSALSRWFNSLPKRNFAAAAALQFVLTEGAWHAVESTVAVGTSVSMFPPESCSSSWFSHQLTVFWCFWCVSLCFGFIRFVHSIPPYTQLHCWISAKFEVLKSLPQSGESSQMLENKCGSSRHTRHVK